MTPWRAPFHFCLLLLIWPGAVYADLTWTQLAPLPDEFGFGGPSVGVVDDALVVAGGANFPDGPPWEGGQKVYHDRIFALDSPTAEWTETGRLPVRLAYNASLTTDDGLLILGGESDGNAVADVYRLRRAPDSGKMVIDELPALPKPAANLSAARIGSTVYVVAAGRSAGSDRLNEKYFWSLDLALLTNGRTATWNPLPTWPGPPRHQAIVAVQAFGNGQENLFLFSGSNPHFFSDGSPDLENFEYYSDAYRYDPTREVWTSVADLPVVEDDRDLPNRQQFAGQRRPVAAGAGIGLSSIFPTQSTGSGSAISIEMEG